MRNVLRLEHSLGSIEIIATRQTGVSDLFWLKLQSEWGTTGRNPGISIRIPLSTFLARLQWVAPYCRRYEVEIDWQGSAYEIVVRRQTIHRLLEQALNSHNGPDASVILKTISDGRFERPLRRFQVRDLVRLASLAHGANFSVPGAGKTSVTYALYEYVRRAQELAQLLVVAPVSAFEAWELESPECLTPEPIVQRFDGSIHNDTEVLLVSYQRLATGYSVLADWITSKPTHMVLDEAHRMKRGWAGAWGRNCLNLAHIATRRDIMTGTPAPQSISDLYALLEFLWPGKSGDLLPADITKSDQASAASQRIAPLFVRTTKAELELPPPRIEVHKEALGDLHREIYSALIGYYRGAYQLSKRGQFDLRALGTVTMYLLEAATNPSLLVSGSHPHDPIVFRHPPLDVPVDTELEALLRAYANYEVPWKFTYLRRVVAHNVNLGRKTLVWSNFVRNLETLRHHELSVHNPAIVHGGIAERHIELAKFREDPDCHVLLANPAATAEGISLHQVCHDAIYLERTFNAGQYLQSLDRIHRLGLAPDTRTRVKVLCSGDTIDEVVDEGVTEKTERLSRLMQDPGLIVMSLPSVPEEGLEGGLDLGLEQRDLIGLRSHIGIV